MMTLCKHCGIRPATPHDQYGGCCSLQCRDAFNEERFAEAVGDLLVVCDKLVRFWDSPNHFGMIESDELIDKIAIEVRNVKELM
jgi:hypothetical protein